MLEPFTKTNCEKTNQKECRIEKVIKRKEDKLYVKCNVYDNWFNSWIDKKDSINEWILSIIKIFRRKSKSLFNYATKTGLKNATNVDTSFFAKKADLTI